MKILKDFVRLFYPSLCFGCGEGLVRNERVICVRCQAHLPATGFHLDKENKVVKFFWGRVDVTFATSYLFFRKGSMVQRLLHELKYRGEKEIGTFLGERYGEDLKQNPLFESIDLIVFVPLHPAKQRKRGYNQSELFADGLSASLQKPVDRRSLVRMRRTETQTRKNRFDRWENVEDVFSLADPGIFENKHVLLVDDVVTTGATLEACARALLDVAGCRVCIATIAMTL